MIAKFLEENDESDLIEYLKKVYRNKNKVSESEKIEIKEYYSANYMLLGIIGLILDNKPRILLGKKQVYDSEIQEMCEKIPISKDVLYEIADNFLEDDFSEESEFILRQVMLEYPNEEGE